MSVNYQSRRLFCDRHGRESRPYVICKHVLAGAAVKLIEHPRDSPIGIGQICCGEELPHGADDAELICGNCAVEAGFLPNIT